MNHPIDEIRIEVAALQDRINAISAMLPETQRLEFSVMKFHRPGELLERHSLVVAVRAMVCGADVTLKWDVVRRLSSILLGVTACNRNLPCSHLTPFPAQINCE